LSPLDDDDDAFAVFVAFEVELGFVSLGKAAVGAGCDKEALKGGKDDAADCGGAGGASWDVPVLLKEYDVGC
jgi:hypothetical protein